ncbi:MAG: monovalent cation/H(+) antiporter subunit G [Lachnospiraceae bacterium]|nr:monovalent cation/H(+) antiporter subunit G [Lachnospiraceae bacterium]
MEWVRLIIGSICIVCGLLIALIAAFGLFKFKFALNRMHAAAMTDTLGILMVLLGLIVMRGFCFDSLKLALIILFFWFASPVSSHLLAGMEVEISDRLKDNCEVEETERKGGRQ